MVRALAFDQCCLGSISWPAVICGRGLSLLVLYSFLRGFTPGTPVFPSQQKPTFDLIWRDSVWFVVSSISKATVLGWIHWDLNNVYYYHYYYYYYYYYYPYVEYKQNPSQAIKKSLCLRRHYMTTGLNLIMQRYSTWMWKGKVFIRGRSSVPRVLPFPAGVDRGCQVISGCGRHLGLTDTRGLDLMLLSIRCQKRWI